MLLIREQTDKNKNVKICALLCSWNIGFSAYPTQTRCWWLSAFGSGFSGFFGFGFSLDKRRMWRLKVHKDPYINVNVGTIKRRWRRRKMDMGSFGCDMNAQSSRWRCLAGEEGWEQKERHTHSSHWMTLNVALLTKRREARFTDREELKHRGRRTEATNSLPDSSFPFVFGVKLRFCLPPLSRYLCHGSLPFDSRRWHFTWDNFSECHKASRSLRNQRKVVAAPRQVSAPVWFVSGVGYLLYLWGTFRATIVARRYFLSQQFCSVFCKMLVARFFNVNLLFLIWGRELTLAVRPRCQNKLTFLKS